MTITWRTDIREENHSLRFAEKIESTPQEWKTKDADTFTFEETSAWLHTVELKLLKLEHP